MCFFLLIFDEELCHIIIAIDAGKHERCLVIMVPKVHRVMFQHGFQFSKVVCFDTISDLVGNVLGDIKRVCCIIILQVVPSGFLFLHPL